MESNLGRFVETHWKLPGTHNEKALLLSNRLSVTSMCCILLWLLVEPHSVVLLDGKYPHRHLQPTMLGSEHSFAGVW